MATMANAILAIIAAEGGEVKNSADYGGLTKFGISQRAYPNLDIANLTQNEAADIYQKDYWLKYKLDIIVSQNVANLVMLIFINMNPINAAKIVQRAIARYINTIIIDGIM